MIQLPAIALSLVLSVLYAALFHVWRGETVRELLLYVVASALGFGLGQLVASLTGMELLKIGQIHLLQATIGAWTLMFVARWLKM